MVLDADERLVNGDFEKIKEEIGTAEIFKFPFLDIFPDRTSSIQHNDIGAYRLFLKHPDIKFCCNVWKNLLFPSSLEVRNSGVLIKHFCPTREDYSKKLQDWYCASRFDRNFQKQIDDGVAPSQSTSFTSWKQPNSYRDMILKA